jgi:hypothetical protein
MAGKTSHDGEAPYNIQIHGSWWRGTIKTKNPDPPIVRKMVEIAERLKACVQADGGEVYLSGGRAERDGVIDISPGMDWRNWVMSHRAVDTPPNKRLKLTLNRVYGRITVRCARRDS